MCKSYFNSQSTLQKPLSLIQTLGTPSQFNGKLSSPGLKAVDEVGISFSQVCLYWLSSSGQCPTSSWAESSKIPGDKKPKIWNSTRRVEFTDPEVLGRDDQLRNPAFYRFVLLSYRILSSVLSIQFEMTLSLSSLLSNNHSLLFLSLLSSSSRWLIISESWNLHMESHLYHEKATFNKILIRNIWLLQSVGFFYISEG